MVDYYESLFHKSSASTFSKAHHLRMNTTEAEDLLWQQIRNRRISKAKFRRQHPLGAFIADFYCPELLLVVEIDGGIHQGEENRKYDEQRERSMSLDGIRTIRFTNEEVINDIAAVVRRIKEVIEEMRSGSSAL